MAFLKMHKFRLFTALMPVCFSYILPAAPHMSTLQTGHMCTPELNHRAASPVAVIFITTIFTTQVWKWPCELLTFTLHLHQCDTESPVAHLLGLGKAVEKPEPMALQQPAGTSERAKTTEMCHKVKEFTPELLCRNALDFLLQNKTYYFV